MNLKIVWNNLMKVLRLKKLLKNVMIKKQNKLIIIISRNFKKNLKKIVNKTSVNHNHKAMMMKKKKSMFIKKYVMIVSINMINYLLLK